MRSAGRIAFMVAVALTVAGVTLSGWHTRSLRAQDSPKASPPDAPKGDPTTNPTPLPSEPPLSYPDAGNQSTLELTPATPAPPTSIGPEQGPAAPNVAVPDNDDPEKNARAFAERNRKEAHDELKKLKDEAERLRTRLGKVEAGIRRWEALLGALENSERNEPPRGVVPTSTVVPTAEHPTNLEAIPRAKSATVIRESVPATSPAPAPR